MASSISYPSHILLSTSLSTLPKPGRPKCRQRLLVFAAKGDVGHHMVDENMIVLRKRIHEMKIVEGKYEPPSEWMDWEKRNYVSYTAYISEVMTVLQSMLMNTRPSLALGMMVLIALSMPVSSYVVISNAMGIVNGVLKAV
ncbi:hypothetical protein L1887_15629 [Cichorium endivia]|nr:hypothetical protein L1887_15629 [Cichorium endivia]